MISSMADAAVPSQAATAEVAGNQTGCPASNPAATEATATLAAHPRQSQTSCPPLATDSATAERAGNRKRSPLAVTRAEPVVAILEEAHSSQAPMQKGFIQRPISHPEGRQAAAAVATGDQPQRTIVPTP
eukprot:CAMPEP_0185584640 /NCGR_PEP_ID=MMETSP0434-20130131/33462_1 /TAXON_ID=626734 ORGANISM="Favella taraikaensis, Strain Fe Narragansett Bay" /NCGR_SAMPLE_ID=MMETSP0434 /ASSEMBLY_ACC=CAM_ASM_000379 /LENGTH=129 /DNA_ID=CAMNT_0028204511 /DNA_START=1212 /DNA_END=1602 /DNA_ORIENTATION=+